MSTPLFETVCWLDRGWQTRLVEEDTPRAELVVVGTFDSEANALQAGKDALSAEPDYIAVSIRVVSPYTQGVTTACDFLHEIEAESINGGETRSYLEQWLDGLDGKERTGFLAALSEYIAAAAVGSVLSPELLLNEMLEARA